jgi:hypothetical protein
LIGLISAFVAFIRTPKEQRYSLRHVKEEGADYAAEYTKRERILLIAKNIAWALPLFAITKFYL